MCLLLMIYEINHIFFYVFIFRRNGGPKGQKIFFGDWGPPCLRDWMISTPLPPPTPFSEGLDAPLRACLQANF